MTPRPILKNRTSYEYFPSPSTALPFRCLRSPHVHFPPTPTLTDTQITHSPFVYDRAPIIVSPNGCELPERGGRMYSVFPASPQEDRGFYSPSVPKGSYFYPRTSEVCEPESPVDPPAPFDLTLPPLIPDLSSSSEESEDSDTYGSPPPLSCSPLTKNTSGTTARRTPFPISIHLEEEDMNAFLPYPRSPYPRSPYPRSPMRKGKKGKGKGKGGRDTSQPRSDDGFGDAAGELSLDGCLGGF
ncbi:hypothetical protein Hypma_008486 [Hypsizygus marmoreus]|uniref:Uncharacterized protein n=1 Tax=Hypsizygus marmoreus TaxID=39966 RepID=A0A369JQD8_HYPMA|nr:hypothetical protein Hypma_008486 [Hypsizygus marmoreus]